MRVATSVARRYEHRIDLRAYRHAVADLATEVGRAEPDRAERLLTQWLAEPEFAGLLRRTPHGVDGALRTLLKEIRGYRPHLPTSARDLSALVRIYLCSQIDAAWWGRVRPYRTDAELLGSPDLVDLDRLDLRLVYRRQSNRFVVRALRAAERRLCPKRAPRTAGLRFTRTRPESVALLETIAARFAAAAPKGTPPLWVTSLARSVEHQHRLRSLGYTAMLPSAHCVGYATDVEVDWYRRFGAHDLLRSLLLEHQDAGDANVIDEGQVWHVCVSPLAVARLTRSTDR